MEPSKLGSAGEWLTPRNTPLPTYVILPNLVVLRQTVQALLRRSPEIWFIASRLSRPLNWSSEPTQTDTPRDFLLTFHSNHVPISYHFRDKRRFQSKIAKFSHPVYFEPSAEGVPVGIGYQLALGVITLTMMGLSGRERSLTIFNRLDTPTWRTDTGRQQRPRLQARTSRGKNHFESNFSDIFFSRSSVPT